MEAIKNTKAASLPSYEQLYKEAEMVALLAHKGQTYDIYPYEKHLRDVVAILKKHGFSGAILVAGWLHDTIEDTTITYSKLKNAFGKEIAEIVFAVTDELGRNRKERKEKTYPKIRSCGNSAIIVKLADRIANLEHSIRMGNNQKDMYQEEYKTFWSSLYIQGTPAEPLWDQLEEILNEM